MTDVIIIGAGISGMTSAIISSDEGLSVRLIDKNGFLTSFEDYRLFSSLPLFSNFTPSVFCEILAKDVSNRGIELTLAKAISVSKPDEYFEVLCDSGTYLSYSVIIAAGREHGISCPSVEERSQIDEECRTSSAGLMLCGNARREAGLLRCMADGIVCGETAKEWVKGKFYS